MVPSSRSKTIGVAVITDLAFTSSVQPGTISAPTVTENFAGVFPGVSVPVGAA